MQNEKRDYLPVNVEITIFDSLDIVTTSWLGSEGNVDSDGWT